MKAPHEIASDFDAIADSLGRLPARGRLLPAERALLRHVLPGGRVALDAGCGDGLVSRELARRGLRVTAVDLSPRMVELARVNTPAALDVHYVVGDIMAAAYPLGAFDVVVSINMVHHVPLEAIVPRLASLVAPGGVLLVQDVVTRRGLRHLARNAAGAMQRLARRITHPRTYSQALAELYERHGRGETYLTPEGAATAYRRLLPGARVEHHVEWRYSAIWSRPAET